MDREDLQGAFAASCIELDLVLPAILVLDIRPESHLFEHLAQLACRSIACAHETVNDSIVHVLVWRLSSILDQDSTDVQNLVVMSFRPRIAQVFVEDMSRQTGERDFVPRFSRIWRLWYVPGAKGRSARLRKEGVVVR